MKSAHIIKKLLNSFGVGIIKYSTEKILIENNRRYRDLSSVIDFLKYLSVEHLKEALDVVSLARAQLHQDIFVLVLLDYKKKGFFVEFGATNGIDFSNTWLLESEFEWQGILAEPGKRWHKDLHKNRRCHISEKCVWKSSNENLLFNEARDGGFSTIDCFSFGDHHFESREKGAKYDVETVSLTDLLSSFNAPKSIDYLSIDTEGSELEILSTLDFQEWDIAIITVEHNFTDERDIIKRLLEKHDYKRVLSSISNVDDWYVKSYLVDTVYKKFSLK